MAESKELSTGERWKNWVKHLRFRIVLLLSDGVFWWSKIRQAFGAERGLEDILEDQMKTMAKDFGVELNHGVFEG